MKIANREALALHGAIAATCVGTVAFALLASSRLGGWAPPLCITCWILGTLISLRGERRAGEQPKFSGGFIGFAAAVALGYLISEQIERRQDAYALFGLSSLFFIGVLQGRRLARSVDSQ